MNREIKFRAYDKKFKVMKYSWLCNDYSKTVDVLNLKISEWEDSHVSVMQYTGLKDKNGKEIYEGDIFSCHLDGKLHNIEIIFLHGCFGWKDPTCKNKFVDMHTTMQVFSTVNEGREIEIIGNKFENPELLEG